MVFTYWCEIQNWRSYEVLKSYKSQKPVSKTAKIAEIFFKTRLAWPCDYKSFIQTFLTNSQIFWKFRCKRKTDNWPSPHPLLEDLASFIFFRKWFEAVQQKISFHFNSILFHKSVREWEILGENMNILNYYLFHFSTFFLCTHWKTQKFADFIKKLWIFKIQWKSNFVKGKFSKFDHLYSNSLGTFEIQHNIWARSV